MINEVIRAVLDTMIGAAIAILELLPQSPFIALSNSVVAEYLGYIAWIIPINQIIAILQAWTTAILIYYSYKTILRWIKVIQ